MTGCCPNGTPAVAVAEGCVRIAKLLAAPGTSRKTPKLELVDIPTTIAVPLSVRLPVAKGVPAVGRTRTFCQVILEKVLPELLLLIVKVSWVVVTEVIEKDVPALAAPLMLADPPPPAF